MYYTSTRDHTQKISLSTAIKTGLADDGGLYVPQSFPQVDLKSFATVTDYPSFMQQLLQPYFKGDKLYPELAAICQQAMNFPIPLKQLDQLTYLLELFHGPTLSFKDVGARFLAHCLERLPAPTTKKMTILVATSGDTGSAVASAFYQKKHINVVCLFPQGQVSKRQEHQITCWGENVLALSVAGSFDDCQKLVKDLFNQTQLQTYTHLSTANSINIGRLLPQISYYAYWSLKFHTQQQQQLGFIIPTGNLGNATAAYWAKAMGFPIREIVLATNANQVIGDYLATGRYTPRKSTTTLANAMDVGKPSNFERLQDRFPNFADFKTQVTAVSVSDAQIKQAIFECYQKHNRFICPHTATGYFVRQQLSEKPWIITATADPCKFETIIEPILDQRIPVAPQLKTLLAKPSYKSEAIPKLEIITEHVIDYFQYKQNN